MQLPFDGYVRVSQVRGREGESFISPAVQRERVEAWAASRGYAIGTMHEDLDWSGGKADRPGLAAALARCESGKAGGIVVAKLDRLSRSVADAATIIRRLDAAGCELVSVADGFDSTTPVGRFARTMMLAMAELEWERVKENWIVARERAVARGVHISPRPPVGYSRAEDGRLEPNEHAPAVREAFLARARGVALTRIGRDLEAAGAEPPMGGKHWTLAALGAVLANPVYTGQARSGDLVKEDAHPAIVSRRELKAAMAARSTRARPSAAPREREPLLTGIARCGGCRYALRPGARNTRDKSPGAELVYRCRIRHPNGRCPAPATVECRELDAGVWERFCAPIEFGGWRRQPGSSTEAEEAARAVLDAEHELDAYVRSVSATEEGFRAGLTARQDALRAARSAVDALEAQAQPPIATPERLAELDERFPLAEWWHALPEVARIVLASQLDAVVVWAADENGDNRVELVKRGAAPDDLPRRGRANVVKSWST
jgi:site-specific DNA recombinase